MDIIKQAIAATLKTVEGTPDEWLNPAKGILTKFVNQEPLRKDITLLAGEEPIYEFASDECYSLITSKRVISFREGTLIEKDLTQISRVSKWTTKTPFEEQDYIKTLIVKDVNQEEFLIEFDPGYPAYFANILILNLAYQLRLGKWFLNPSK